MHNKLMAALCAALATIGMAIAAPAQAQSWSEANTPGFFGGYGHFGGYYDTFGDFGGHSTYNGYVRTEGYRSQTATLLTVPLQRRTPTTRRRHAELAVAVADSSALKRRAHETGQRKWKLRYDACRRDA